MSAPAARSVANRWKELPFHQKVVYGGAVFNVVVLSFTFVKRQFKLAEKEAETQKVRTAFEQEASGPSALETSQFRCFFAARRYRSMNTSGPQDEVEDEEVMKVLKVLDQCKEDVYTHLPPTTPSMREVHTRS
eukprot:gnl/MRDRNA2_/MRDRNA2_148361_c0_seq1.p1 gnl/MRDRNA2_/MRDRNA2_148361_c0~~gnl/MRDRNA2_/MRDRNA2_148361_c0_seq1.p1  ORF type:complete len:133 (-),score=30.15 gnl/MRDRNA2_/MRDRNA2_148361_c0_seq1:73-471(-)